MPTRHSQRLLAAVALLCGLAAPWEAPAAQDAAYFSPTYAASQGSPYSEVYARTFGAAPLETAAATPGAAKNGGPAVVAPAVVAPGVVPGVIYVIEGGRLLAYSADDYARDQGDALAGSAPTTATPDGRLYGAAPPAPTADESPILLLPQQPAR